MKPYFAEINLNAAGTALAASTRPPALVRRLRKQDEPEVLACLRQRALHNVVMSGLIRDHGIESELNRGTFYGLRGADDLLEGVALIGHATFIAARRNAVVREFARSAQTLAGIHMVLGEDEVVEQFWQAYAGGGQALRQRCREILFELNDVPLSFAAVPELRLATASDLRHVAAVQATLASEESGVNPLHQDHKGFLRRCQLRIERNRVWTWIRNGELIFKADVISDTPEAVYLEGIYVHPAFRNQGLGSRCVAQVARELLTHAPSIVVLVNENRTSACRFFQRVGFVARSIYATLFLGERNCDDGATPRQELEERE